MRRARPSILFACALLGAAVLFGGAPAAGAARLPGSSVHLDPTLPVHPALQYGAQVEPNKVVRVLVQKARGELDRRDDADPDIVEGEKFSLAQTKVLALPQRKVLELARKPGVRYISPDGAVQRHTAIDPKNLVTTYPLSARADKAWSTSASGQGVTVAVLDTGVNPDHTDFPQGGIKSFNVNRSALGAGDTYGHGTHVIGVIKADNARGNYIGVAPNATVLSVKIADDTGLAHESDLLRGLQWVYDNRATYNIRAVNLSVTVGTASSYLTSPTAAAAEQLWRNGVVVVVAAGNNGTASDATWYAPANDPYVITVGALDDNATSDVNDDSLAVFSSRGATQDGYAKPDVVAPGRKIVSSLAGPSVSLAQQLPDRITPDGQHIRLSGTSMAAPVVTGIVALLLEKNPALTPDQVKWTLTSTTHPHVGQTDAAGAVDAGKAVSVAADGKVGLANLGLVPNSGISLGTGTVSWDTSYWDTSYWDTSYWNVGANYD